MGESVLLKTDLPGLKHVSSGKVRDMFDLGSSLLIVTTDRLSAFDVVMANGIPFKGKVLNRLSEFWFNYLGVAHHMITCDVDQMPADVKKHKDILRDRSMLVKKADPFPVECVARGYLIGSGWKDYQASGAVCGIKLPAGLQQAAKLEKPIFTPATKAVTGHDENIGFDVVAQTVGKDTAEKLRDLTLSIYGKGRTYAETKGVILADTKFEFGRVGGQLTLIDEVLTPDSSRYWPKDGYRPGISPPSYDKQFVRDYLEEIKFNKKPPGPVLPDAIVQKTSEKYLEAFRVLTGHDLGK
jgi:phosphoribosylaminoimidazole-succinocarboxamide synthase